MSEISDLDEVDANNTTLSGLAVTNATLIAQLDDLLRAELGMLKRWFKTSLFRLRDSTDQTKLLAFDLSRLSSGTKTVIAPDQSAQLALAPHLAGMIFGLTLSNNVTDAVNDIDIASGMAIDGGNAEALTLASALTKRLDAAWVVGTNQGGRDTGAIADGTWHMWLIKRVDTNVVDVLFSLSATAPTMPASYTLKRRIGSVVRISGSIAGFVQEGDSFLFSSPTVDINTNTQGTTAILYTLPLPKGIKTIALLSGYFTNAAVASLYISSPYQTDIAANNNGPAVAAGGLAAVQNAQILTNTSGQIRVRGDTAATQLRFANIGWIDSRGRI